ncbi:MAG: energy-coupling factor transporter ATPase [Treponema sp.]|nr:energy-coupling factor transporter ATPase [Treponema sp.]
MSIISVNKLNFSYSQNDKVIPILSDVSFKIERGSYTALVGSNGSGKSTLAKIICSLIPLEQKEETLKNEKTIQIEENVTLGLVFQSPKDQLVSAVISRDTAFGPQNLGLKKDEVELRTIESLNTVEMLSKANESTSAISFGQTQKVAIAGIVAINPDILILDEAVSMLDEVSRKGIYDFLRFWHKQGKTIIHITHDEEAVYEAEKIIFLEKGHILFDGSKEDFISNQEYFSMIKGPSLKSIKSKGTVSSEVALEFENVYFNYNEKNSVNNISFKLYKGSLVALTGPSGAGKSTIMELGSGLLQPLSGNIKTIDRPVLAQQNCSSALFEAFAADDVAFGPRNLGLKGKELKERVVSSMEKVRLPFAEFGEKQSVHLSGGQKRRLAIAGILAMDKDIIFFDEPSAGLDGQSRYEIMNLLRQLADEGKTVLFSTHKRDEASFADREIYIEDGKIAFDSYTISGDSSSVFENLVKKEDKLQDMEPYSFVTTLNNLRNISQRLSSAKVKNATLISNAPPVLKILIFLAMFVFSIAARPLYLCAIAFVASVLYCVISGFKIKKLLVAMLKILPFLLVFSLFQLIFHSPLPGEVIYINLKYFTITPSKLLFCLKTLLRTDASLACISAFFVSTPEYDLIDGMNLLLKPLELLKIPVRYLILILEIIFRFIPLLVEETSGIIKTQLIRGGFGKVKNGFAKLKVMIPMFVPLIIQTIKRSETLADAITMRCFK